ncbi:MAG: alpha/beta hydrolase [Lachnospiraceae bacterium]|nr:alpha/beta hydrolase [Lachnospiraceae bacterium]
MEVYEFGKENDRKIVLIPGNMMCWKQFENVIPLLANEFHIIAISTDGYDGTGETIFTTAEASAEGLETYIREHLDGEIDLVFGESFGGATAGILFHRQCVRVGAMILSGPQYMSLGPLTGILSAIIPRNQYRLLYNIQTQKKLPWLLKVYTRTDDEKLLGQFKNVPPNISFDTLKNAMSEAIRLYETIDGFQPDPSACVAIWHGAKEPNMKIALQKLKRAWPNLEDHPFPNFGHGEIIAHPDLMAEEIRKFLEIDAGSIRQRKS